MTKRGPTKPAKRKRAVKRQRKSAIRLNEALAHSGYESNHPGLHRTKSIRAERRRSVAISGRGG